MRPVKPRPLSEHVQTLARIQRQVDADKRLTPERRSQILKALGEAMAELQTALSEK